MTDDRERAFLRAVADDDCRTILKAIEEDRKTVSEISDECDIPLSTVYRKVNELEDAGMIEQKNRLCQGSKPENVYDLCFEGAVIGIDDGGDVEVTFTDQEDQSVVHFGYPSRPPAQSD